MVEWSIVMPRFIREKKGLMNAMFRLEQEGEHAHQILNSLETRFKSVFNKSERYFLILKEFENKHYAKNDLNVKRNSVIPVLISLLGLLYSK